MYMPSEAVLSLTLWVVGIRRTWAYQGTVVRAVLGCIPTADRSAVTGAGDGAVPLRFFRCTSSP